MGFLYFFISQVFVLEELSVLVIVTRVVSSFEVTEEVKLFSAKVLDVGQLFVRVVTEIRVHCP